MTQHTEQSVRAEVSAWLKANWNPELGLVEWRNKLVDSGWGAPHWPKKWHGRDLPVGLVPVVEDEIEKAGAVGVAKMGIRTLAAATIHVAAATLGCRNPSGMCMEGSLGNRYSRVARATT
jgi:alkylation response protein AidB-like acyl-CoA dehydrogenase